jgi:hypothetical protein
MKAALERSRSGAYHTLMVGEAPAHLQQLDAYRQQRRDMFNQQFHQVHGGAVGEALGGPGSADVQDGGLCACLVAVVVFESPSPRP